MTTLPATEVLPTAVQAEGRRAKPSSIQTCGARGGLEVMPVAKIRRPAQSEALRFGD